MTGTPARSRAGARKAAPAKAAPAKRTAGGRPAEAKSHSDQLIDEVAAQLPDDAPVMLGLHQITKRRRLRAKLARRIAEIEPLMQRLDAAEKAGVLDTRHADTFELMADIEDFLRDFAADPAEFDEWVEDADDTDLVALLAVFARGLNQGEASSSST